MILEKLIAHRKHNDKKLKFLRQKLSEFPSGKLVCYKNGKYYKWFQAFPNRRVHISKSNPQFAELLAEKNYYIYQLEDLLIEQKALNSHIKTLSKHKNKVDEFLCTPSEELRLFLKNHTPLNQELSEWSRASYYKNPKYKKDLIHRTVGGNMVRSKSEAMIFAALTKHNIPFHYEECLPFESFDMFPDFTIRHPRTGEKLIWEHFGAMDKPKYQRDTLNKLQTYMLNGYYPGVQLIMTFETKLHPLDPFYVERVIEYYFEAF